MYCNFDEIETYDNLKPDSLDVIFGNDTFLHSSDKTKLVSELAKLLRKDGVLIFTDILEQPNSNKEMLNGIYSRLNLQSLASAAQYETDLESAGLKK